jgi:hypothetical protein
MSTVLQGIIEGAGTLIADNQNYPLKGLTFAIRVEVVKVLVTVMPNSGVPATSRTFQIAIPGTDTPIPVLAVEGCSGGGSPTLDHLHFEVSDPKYLELIATKLQLNAFRQP